MDIEFNDADILSEVPQVLLWVAAGFWQHTAEVLRIMFVGF